MTVDPLLLGRIAHSIPPLQGDMTSRNWPERVNTGADIDFGFDFRDPNQFMGRIVSQEAAGMRLFGVNCESHVVFREQDQLVSNASAADSYYLLTLQAGGSKIVSQNGQSARLGSEEFLLYDSSSPLTLDVRNDYRSVNITFPKHELTAEDRAVLDACALQPLSVREGIAPLVWSTLLGLREHSDLINTQYRDLKHSLIEMMVLMMKARAMGLAPTQSADDRLGTLKQYILNHLTDSGLSVEQVALANYTSVRTVHKLFSEVGETPAAWIRDQRIPRAKKILTEKGRELTITQVAEMSGFTSAAQFSAVFRQVTEVTPTQYRDSR